MTIQTGRINISQMAVHTLITDSVMIQMQRSVGQTYSAGSITYSFNPFGTGTAPSGNTIYSSAGTPYTTSIPADSVNYIFKHTFSGNTTGKSRDDSSSYGYTFTGAQFYDVGYTTWGSGTTVSPNSYGYTGTNQNRDYRVYGFNQVLVSILKYL